MTIGLMTLLYQTLQSMLQDMIYGNSAHMDDDCKQQLCIHNCGQTDTDISLETWIGYY